MMEKTEAERLQLIELVRTLEVKLHSVEQSSAEEQWALRQKNATLDAERKYFLYFIFEHFSIYEELWTTYFNRDIIRPRKGIRTGKTSGGGEENYGKWGGMNRKWTLTLVY